MQLKLIENNTSKLLIGYYLIIFVWWLVLFLTSSQNNLFNYLFGFFFAIIPLLGGIVGVTNSKKWGLMKSALGKSTLFISLGLITWAAGQIIFSCYNLFLQVQVPYPSIADASFILSWPLWGIGVYYLSKATGAKYGLKSLGGKFMLLLIPFTIIPLSYYLLVNIAREGILISSFDGYIKLFFDLAYPVGTMVILTSAALIFALSNKYFGGRFKMAISIILIGFVINYIADFSFSYTTTVGSFYSGNWVDLLFTTAMFALSLGVAMLDPELLKEDTRS